MLRFRKRRRMALADRETIFLMTHAIIAAWREGRAPNVVHRPDDAWLVERAETDAQLFWDFVVERTGTGRDDG